MRKQKEITSNVKSDDFTKAVSYSKRLLKQKLYHSKTLQMKLEARYTDRVVAKTLKYLENQCFFDNELYIKKLKELCMKKYYGVRRFKKILNEKGIYNKESYYTLEEEGCVLNDFLEHCMMKYSKLDVDDYIKKVTYLVKYKGFSSFNVNKFIEG